MKKKHITDDIVILRQGHQCARCKPVLHFRGSVIVTSYLSHPEILIRKPIRISQNLRIHPKFRSGGILGNLIFQSGQNYVKKLYQEICKNDPETPTLYPERNFIDPEKKCWSSG